MQCQPIDASFFCSSLSLNLLRSILFRQNAHWSWAERNTCILHAHARNSRSRKWPTDTSGVPNQDVREALDHSTYTGTHNWTKTSLPAIRVLYSCLLLLTYNGVSVLSWACPYHSIKFFQRNLRNHRLLFSTVHSSGFLLLQWTSYRPLNLHSQNSHRYPDSLTLFYSIRLNARKVLCFAYLRWPNIGISHCGSGSIKDIEFYSNGFLGKKRLPKSCHSLLSSIWSIETLCRYSNCSISATLRSSWNHFRMSSDFIPEVFWRQHFDLTSVRKNLLHKIVCRW